jgi:hypothetical protein
VTVRPRPRRRRSWQRALVVLAALALAFVAGIGLGEALHDNPRPGGSQTVVRTLTPLSVPRIATETVTVTTSNH